MFLIKDVQSVSEAFFLCSSANDPKRKTLSKVLVEEENILKQCIEKLNSVEASRVALVSQLKEALNEQVSDKTTIFSMSNEFLIIQHRLRAMIYLLLYATHDSSMQLFVLTV